MSIDRWTAVDQYFDARFMEQDENLERALQHSRDAGLPEIAVAPNQGKLLQMLVQIQGATSILEIGTLGGYSTIWLARGLPDDGKLISLEYEEKHAEVARKNIADAGLSDKVTVIVGDACETLPTLTESAPFDFVFMDANKDGYPTYLDWSIKLGRSGTTIFADNVVRNGEVANLESTDEIVNGVQKMSDMIAKDDRIDAIALQTVGAKSYDGFALIRVK